MGWTKQEREERKRAIEKRKQVEEMRAAQGQYEFEQAEKAAYLAGEAKKGGFLGFGGSYSGKSPEDFATGAEMAGKGAGIAGKLDKVSAAKSLVEGVTGQSVGDMLGGGEGGGAASGAMSGAQAGFKAFGPKGAIIGGIAGAVMGAGAAREKRKAHNRMIEAKKHKAMGEIAMEEGRQIGEALSGMGSRIGASLR